MSSNEKVIKSDEKDDEIKIEEHDLQLKTEAIVTVKEECDLDDDYRDGDCNNGNNDDDDGDGEMVEEPDNPSECKYCLYY